MENNQSGEDDSNAPKKLIPTPVGAEAKKKTRKPKSQPTKARQSKEKTLRQLWKGADGLRKVEIFILGLGAAAGIAYVVVAILGNMQNKSQFAFSHAPLVVHNRPPELLMPLVCDAKKGQLNTGNMQTFVKNIGNATAEDVNAIFGNMARVVPDRKRGDKMLDDPPIGNCAGQFDKTPMDFPLPPGEQKAFNLRQSAMTIPQLDEGEKVRFYLAECAYYSDGTAKHGTCDTYQLEVPSSEPLDRLNGTESFACDGTPISGKFAETIGGHCQK